MYPRLLKFLHEVSTVGVMGSIAACLVLVVVSPTDSPVEFAAIRRGIAAIVRWLLIPSLAVVIVSGLLAIAANRTYMNAGWAWMKALLGISMFEGTLLTIGASARRAAELASQAVDGVGDPAALAQVLRTEWGGLWIILGVCVANIVLAVWRPRFSRKRA